MNKEQKPYRYVKDPTVRSMDSLCLLMASYRLWRSCVWARAQEPCDQYSSVPRTWSDSRSWLEYQIGYLECRLYRLRVVYGRALVPNSMFSGWTGWSALYSTITFITWLWLRSSVVLFPWKWLRKQIITSALILIRVTEFVSSTWESAVTLIITTTLSLWMYVVGIPFVIFVCDLENGEGCWLVGPLAAHAKDRPRGKIRCQDGFEAQILPEHLFSSAVGLLRFLSP